MGMSATSVPESETRSPLLQHFPALWGNRNFLLLWIGYVISALGDRIHFIVMLRLVSDLISRRDGHTFEAGTNESAQLTIMMLLPFLLFGPLTGILADRLPRRMIMLVSDLVRVVIVIAARVLFLRNGLALPYEALYAMLLASEFILAMFAAAFSPARLALMPQLVHPDQLLRANSMTNAAGTIASLLGFVLGGVLVKWDLQLAMFTDAGTFFGSAVCLFLMRVPRHLAGPALGQKKVGVMRELFDGLRYIACHRRVLQIILLMLLFWSCGAVILNGLTGVVTRIYGLTIDEYAYFMGVVGVGMIVGAASVSLARHGVPKEVGIAWAMVTVGACLVGFSQMRSWQLGVCFLVPAAAAGAVLLVSLDTLLQRIVPNFVRGRVMGAKDVITTLGLVSMAVPLAFWDKIDHIILRILLGLAIFVTIVGLWLVVLYYRSQTLPPALAIIVRFGRAFFGFWHRFERLGACRVPGRGPVIVVANHSAGFDPILLQISCPRRVIHFMMAKDYYNMKALNWFYRAIQVIPVNRTGTDIASIRAAVRVLKEGRVLGMFPEGRISLDGNLQTPRNGVAAIVMMGKATVVPAYIAGTLPYKSMFGDFFRRTRLTIRYGAPLHFDEFAGKDRDKETLDQVTAKIFGAIIDLGNKDRAAKGLPPLALPQRGEEARGGEEASGDEATGDA